MNGEEIEERIIDWFSERYPGNPSADCHRALPIELRAIVFTSMVEGEISNGGSAQLLWNTLHHWREVLDDAEVGYQLFCLPGSRESVRSLRKLFEQYESECRLYRQGGDCSKWCGYANPLMEQLDHKLFSDSFPDAGYEKRQAWIKANEERLLQLTVA